MLLLVFISIAIVNAASGAVLTDSQKFKFEWYLTRQRVEILREELATECPHLFQENEILGRREVISGGKEEILHNIEKQLVDHLTQMLAQCQLNGTRIPAVSVPLECTSPATLYLTDNWRNNYTGNGVNSDNKIIHSNKTWFKFQGAAGTRVRNTCPHYFECGSSGAYWSKDPMPDRVGETATITLYESYRQKGEPTTSPDCTDNGVIKALATRCSAYGDFIYMLKEPFNSNLDTVCGMD